MILGITKSCTCSELIHVLGRDPYYGVRLIRADTGEPYVIDPNSSGKFRTKRKPGKQSDDKAQEPPIWGYDPELDTIYDTDSEETKSILDAIYQGKANRDNFKVRFGDLPCSVDLLRHLVYSWCGLLGLPYTRNDQSPDNQEIDILQNWSKDFVIRLEDLKVFLRNNNWPLPVRIFDDEPDSTQNKVNLSNNAYEKLVRKQLVLIPEFEQQLKEVQATQPESMSAYEKKQQVVSKLNQRIENLRGASSTHNRRKSPLTKRERGKLATQERYLDWSRQAAIIHEKNFEMFKTDIAKRICKNQKGKTYSWRYICKNMNLEEK